MCALVPVVTLSIYVYIRRHGPYTQAAGILHPSPLPPPGKAFTSPPPPIVSKSGRRKEILNSLVRKVFYDKGCPSALLYIYMQLDRKVVLPVTALLEAFSLFSFAYFRLKFFRRNCTEILRFRARRFIYGEEISALSTLQYDFSRL
jgi:hypothetical protein